MKIGIVGTGALGSFYGAKLSLAGNDVRFLMRSDYAAAVRDGLKVTQEGKPLRVYPCHGYTDAAPIGPCDLVVVTAKTLANAALPAQMAPMVGENTLILTLQNGLGNVECFQKAFGAEKVIGGLCFVAATRIAPAVVEVYFTGSIRIAEPLGPARERTEAIAALFSAAGIPCRTAENFDAILWKKLVWNIPFSGLSVATRTTTDHIMADADLRAQVLALMDEVRAAASAYGHRIEDAFLQDQLTATDKLGAYRPSALVDFENRRPLEIESIWGEPLRRAQAKSVATPRLALLCALLRHLSAANIGIAK